MIKLGKILLLPLVLLAAFFAGVVTTKFSTNISWQRVSEPQGVPSDAPASPTKQPAVYPTIVIKDDDYGERNARHASEKVVRSSQKPSEGIDNNSGGKRDSGYGYPCDDRYATAEEIFGALNNYRKAHGAGSLSWNEKLAEVAQMRVKQTLAGGRDYHQGFIDFTNDQENYKKVGFWELSENIGSSGNCPLLGVHLIEYKIAKSPAHDAAQKDPSWVAVGIATEDSITAFIFGKEPI